MTELAALGIKVNGVSDVKSASDSLKEFTTNAKSSGDAVDKFADKSKKSAKEVNHLAAAAKTAALGLAAGFSVASLKNYADAWSDMQSKVGSSLGDMSKAASTMQRVVDIANASYSPLRQTVDVFTRNVASFRDMGKSASAAADFTEALNHALVTTATKGQDADVVINSLSRSMAIGKLDADAFDTIVSRSPRVLQAMADKMGVATSSIREMAKQGKVTADVIASSLIESLDKLRDEAGAMPATIGDAFQQVTNNTTSLIGALDNMTGASGAAAGGIMLFANGLRDLSNNKEALDTIIIAGETLAVVLGSRLVTAGLASAGSFAAVQIAAIRAAGGINALALASRAAQGALALVGGPLGLLVTAIGVGAFAWSQYGKSARDNADEGVLGLVDAKKSVEDLVIEFNKLNVLQQKQTLAIKQEELTRATEKAKDAVHELSEAYKPFTGKGINAVRQFNIAFKQETAALVANTHMTEAEMAQAFTDLIDGYIASGKAYEDQRPKLEEMAGAAVQAANDVRRLKEEMFALDAMGPPSSAMNSQTGTPTATPTKTKSDPGADLIKQMQERIALIGKETEYEQLLARIRVGSVKFSTEAQKQSALAYAQTLDLLEAQAKAAEEAQKGFEQNTDAVASLEQQLMLASLSGKELAQAQAMLSLNEYATDEQIEKVQRLSAALFEMQETTRQKDKFGEGKDADKYILGDVDPLSGGAFDDQFARYEAEAEAEMERYQGQLDRLIEARELGIETNKTYDELEEQAAQTHASRMQQIEQARYSMMLSSASEGFGALAGIIGNAQGQQSKAYRAMFAVSKAFAVADATMKAYQAISAAWASAPFPANLAAVAMTTPQVLGVVSAIQGASLKGMAHDGIDSIPEEGTWLLNKGERVTTANTSAKLDATLGRIDAQTRNGGSLSGGKPTINIYGAPAGTVVEETERDGEWIIDVIMDDVSRGGRASELLESTYQLGRAGR